MAPASVPVPVERCVVSREITEPRLRPNGSALAYVQSAAGGAALVVHTFDGAPARQLSSHPAPRAGRGMGGGCFCWTASGDAVVYAAVDGELWLQPVPWGQARRLTEHGPSRSAAAPAAFSDGERITYVLDEAEVWCTSIAGSARATRIDDGSADFCFDPCPQPDGRRVVWQAWNVPDMPWDGARACSVELESGALDEHRVVGAVQQPRFLSSGAPIHVSDAGGWANVWVGDRPLVSEPFEHAGPSWGMGQRSFAACPDGGHVAFTRNEGGFGRLCVVDVATGGVREIARGVHGQLSWAGGRLAALRTGARTPTQVVVYDTGTWDRNVIAVGPLSGWEDAGLAEPELVEVTARDGATVHARLHRADDAASGNAARLLCWVHGGPTDQWAVTFMPRIAYWRSRGWNVLLPDPRGSSGHGRAYQQALHGRWGELDVADTIDMIAEAHRRGWGDRAHTVVLGGSSGGLTSLGVGAQAPELLAGVVASYPVTDLADLAEHSHRFERHYTDTLVGPLPEFADVCRERSPVAHAHRLTSRPLLLLHGDSDPVVPLEHSTTLADRVRRAGGDVELHVYAGEGHGFRQIATQLDEYARVEAFLLRCTADG